MSVKDINMLGSSLTVKVKPKKRSLVERELETNLTERVTSPVTNGEGSNTSRYGRTRRLKTSRDYLDTDRAFAKALKSPIVDRSPTKSHSPAYKMHASNSPVKMETPKKAIETNLENQIENIYHENISLSRFGSEDKTKNVAQTKNLTKVYVRKDLIQKTDKEETASLMKNMFSPTKSNQKTNSHLNNILERSSEKYKLNMNGSSGTKLQNGYLDNLSVVKALDFDNGKKKKKDESKSMSKSEIFEMEAKCTYQVGDLAWARVGTYPFWPCLITREPVSGLFVRKKLFGRVEHDIIHVTFFGDNGRRGWIVDNMLRKYLGILEFENTKEKFTIEAKKKDPKLYAAFFVSEKKLPLWNISVEEAEILLREPKRLRIDIFNELLEKSRSKAPKRASGKMSRTNSDVSLSESLFDTLFSEDDGKIEDQERSRSRSINKSLDVSEVVTACLDNMAAKTGITKIQRQSHMDRWLQKAKSKTPEKGQPKPNQVNKKFEKDTKLVSSKKKKKPSPKSSQTQIHYSFRKLNSQNNLTSFQNEHDYTFPSVRRFENGTDRYKAVDNTIIDISGSGIGFITKVETLAGKENDIDCNNSENTAALENEHYMIEQPHFVVEEIITNDNEGSEVVTGEIEKNGMDQLDSKSTLPKDIVDPKIRKNKDRLKLKKTNKFREDKVINSHKDNDKIIVTEEILNEIVDIKDKKKAYISFENISSSSDKSVSTQESHVDAILEAKNTLISALEQTPKLNTVNSAVEDAVKPSGNAIRNKKDSAENDTKSNLNIVNDNLIFDIPDHIDININNIAAENVETSIDINVYNDKIQYTNGKSRDENSSFSTISKQGVIIKDITKNNNLNDNILDLFFNKTDMHSINKSMDKDKSLPKSDVKANNGNRDESSCVDSLHSNVKPDIKNGGVNFDEISCLTHGNTKLDIKSNSENNDKISCARSISSYHICYINSEKNNDERSCNSPILGNTQSYLEARGNGHDNVICDSLLHSNINPYIKTNCKNHDKIICASPLLSKTKIDVESSGKDNGNIVCASPLHDNAKTNIETSGKYDDDIICVSPLHDNTKTGIETSSKYDDDIICVSPLHDNTKTGIETSTKYDDDIICVSPLHDNTKTGIETSTKYDDDIICVSPLHDNTKTGIETSSKYDDDIICISPLHDNNKTGIETGGKNNNIVFAIQLLDNMKTKIETSGKYDDIICVSPLYDNTKTENETSGKYNDIISVSSLYDNTKFDIENSDKYDDDIICVSPLHDHTKTGIETSCKNYDNITCATPLHGRTKPDAKTSNKNCDEVICATLINDNIKFGNNTDCTNVETSCASPTNCNINPDHETTDKICASPLQPNVNTKPDIRTSGRNHDRISGASPSFASPLQRNTKPDTETIGDNNGIIRCVSPILSNKIQNAKKKLGDLIMNICENEEDIPRKNTLTNTIDDVIINIIDEDKTVNKNLCESSADSEYENKNIFIKKDNKTVEKSNGNKPVNDNELRNIDGSNKFNASIANSETLSIEDNTANEVAEKDRFRSKSPELLLKNISSENIAKTLSKDKGLLPVVKDSVHKKLIENYFVRKFPDHGDRTLHQNESIKKESATSAETTSNEEKEKTFQIILYKTKPNENSLSDLKKNEFDLETASINSEDSEISLGKRKSRSKTSSRQGSITMTKALEDPDFQQYFELRQDVLIDENPQLTEEEIVNYLYNTWLYEESLKPETKKSQEETLVKGLKHDPVQKPKKIKKKKVIKEPLLEIDEVLPKEKPKRKLAKPFYNYDFSDLEDEIEGFEIFMTNTKESKKTESEITIKLEDQNINEIPEEEFDEEVYDYEYDEEESYFEALTKPKPNIFKGTVREKVCEVCEKPSHLIKCKICLDMFHIDCNEKEIKVEGLTTPSRGRKRKRKAMSRRTKGLDDSNGLDSESQSDDKSQDANVSDDISFEEADAVPHLVAGVEEFEAHLSKNMKEMLDQNIIANYDSSDCEVDWDASVPGKCEIVDVKLKLKNQINSSLYPDFKCKNCEIYELPLCFVCKSATSPKSKAEYRQKCQLARCNKYFHLECLDHWPQTQLQLTQDKKYEPLRCPRHVCHTCVCDDPRGCKTRFSSDKLARCVRCPATYHCFSKCLPAGTQILTGSQIVCPRHYQHRPGKIPCHVNTGWCFICALGGTLICCEYCPTSFHAECLNIKPPEGSYMCEDCETGRLPLYGEMVWVKLGHYRWWPGIILHPSEIPPNIIAVKHTLGEFVVRFFGQYDHYWVNRGRVFPFQEGDSGRISSQRSKIDEAFTKAMEHAQRACEILKNAEPNFEESHELAQSLLPPQYVKLKSNKPVGRVAVRRDDADHSLTQCECDPTDSDACSPYTSCLNRMLLTECGPSCKAGDRCNNRQFEKRQYPKLVPYRTPHRGWGLKTLEDIKLGQFVIEYVGELISEEEFTRRMTRKHEIRDENFYFLTLDKERMIDAGPKGNLARFMNHCCEPNCETQKWTVLGDVRVGLFAMTDIPANSELTFNYNLESAGIEKKRCLCGAKRCSGYIGAKPKQDESSQKKGKRNVKRPIKKRKVAEELPSTSKYKPKPRQTSRSKPRELTEIEKDLLIIKNATNGLSSDTEHSERLSVEDKKEKPLKRKIITEEFQLSSSSKRVKLEKCDIGD